MCFSWIIPFLFLLSPSLLANPAKQEALSVHVAKSALVSVMQEIAKEIGKMRGDFPQLKKWDQAFISTDRIEYQRAGKNGCELLIYSKGELASEEYKVGVYLKMRAFGEKAELLKETLQAIVAKHFEAIRRLRHFS